MKLTCFLFGFSLLALLSCTVQRKEVSPFLEIVAQQNADSVRVISRNGGHKNEDDTYVIKVKKGAIHFKQFINKQ